MTHDRTRCEGDAGATGEAGETGARTGITVDDAVGPDIEGIDAAVVVARECDLAAVDGGEVIAGGARGCADRAQGQGGRAASTTTIHSHLAGAQVSFVSSGAGDNRAIQHIGSTGVGVVDSGFQS